MNLDSKEIISIHAVPHFVKKVKEGLLTEGQAEAALRAVLKELTTDSTSDATVDSFIDEFHDLLE